MTTVRGNHVLKSAPSSGSFTTSMADPILTANTVFCTEARKGCRTGVTADAWKQESRRDLTVAILCLKASGQRDH